MEKCNHHEHVCSSCAQLVRSACTRRLCTRTCSRRGRVIRFAEHDEDIGVSVTIEITYGHVERLPIMTVAAMIEWALRFTKRPRIVEVAAAVVLEECHGRRIVVEPLPTDTTRIAHSSRLAIDVCDDDIKVPIGIEICKRDMGRGRILLIVLHLLERGPGQGA